MVGLAAELMLAWREMPVAERSEIKIASIMEGWVFEADEK